MSALLLIGLIGCGQRPCATPEDPGRDGALLSVELDGPAEAVESGLRHFSGVIVYQWFEARTDCVDGGDLIANEPGTSSEHDLPYPLLQSPDDPDLWGGWREAETEEEQLWLDWTDESDGCFGADGDCERWPEEAHALLGPWMRAGDWYAEVWWPLVTLE